MPWVYYDTLPRDAENIRCECGEMAEQTDELTPEEVEQYDCHRFLHFTCCARAFICKACGKRTAMKADALEAF